MVMNQRVCVWLCVCVEIRVKKELLGPVEQVCQAHSEIGPHLDPAT